jgi:hypothetical protein
MSLRLKEGAALSSGIKHSGDVSQAHPLNDNDKGDGDSWR